MLQACPRPKLTPLVGVQVAKPISQVEEEYSVDQLMKRLGYGSGPWAESCTFMLLFPLDLELLPLCYGLMSPHDPVIIHIVGHCFFYSFYTLQLDLTQLYDP